MTPPHGTDLENGNTARHLWNCWEDDDGPGKKLRDAVEALRAANIALNATIRTVGRMLTGAVAILTLAVAVLGLLQMREKDRNSKAVHAQSTLIPSAIAQGKATP